MERMDVVWDMETGDPDDFLTLLLLAGHPRVNLKAVTVTPGTPEQIGLVRLALSWFALDIPVGSHICNTDENFEDRAKLPPTARKSSVSLWHDRTFGSVAPSYDAAPGAEVLLEQCDAQTTLVTGGPLKNLGVALARAQAEGRDWVIGRLVAQGGFAGEGVVPEEKQLEKFKGLKMCPTWNLGGAPREAEAALAYDGILERYFVSKNVCHGVVYNRTFQRQVTPFKDKSRSLALIWEAMERYLRKKKRGKKFHDPLAACCAIDRSVGVWEEVRLFRDHNAWGSEKAVGTNTRIIVDYDPERFLEVLTEYAETSQPPLEEDVFRNN